MHYKFYDGLSAPYEAILLKGHLDENEVREALEDELGEALEDEFTRTANHCHKELGG